MLKNIVIIILLFSFSVFAKTLDQEVFGNSAELTKEMNASELLMLNGVRLAITSELDNQKLDSNLFWEKFELKKLTGKTELEELKKLFRDLSVLQYATTSENKNLVPAKEEGRLSGILKGELDSQLLKSYYEQLINNLEETKKKTFYILAEISYDSSMSLEDIGVTKLENFSGVITDSWKKLALKDFGDFAAVSVIEKDFQTRPDYMNNKSVTLKWTSTYKKTNVDDQKKVATYELSSHFILVNTKSGQILTSFDFPLQKREMSTLNKKNLSSNLASLVYSLLLSQSKKIQESLLSQALNESTELELKVTGVGLTEIYALNNLIAERLKDFKAKASVKSYSSASSLINIIAESSLEPILDKLSLEGGKFPLSEQKVLVFNRADKSFAILLKDSNN